MKTKSFHVLFFLIFAFGSFLFQSCSKDESDDQAQSSQFVSLDNPYLICANRNPGGVGFDFEYAGQDGGANNMDNPSVDDFDYDLKIRTIKAEKPDGTLAGAPFIQLHESVMAVNYSDICPSCKGADAFENLNASNIQSYSLITDDSSFDLTSVSTGTTGSPLVQNLNQEFKKLVVGQIWKEAANNDVADDEPVWLIKTREGKIVKFIVTQFPANPAPTSTGYITILWNFVE